MANELRAKILATSVTLAVNVLAAIAPVGATSPDAPRADYFGRSTPSPSSQAPMRGHATSTVRVNLPPPAPNSPHPTVSSASSPEEWMNAFDEYVDAYMPTKADAYIINKPFNQESERVMQFCTTISKVGRNYKILAQKLKSMPATPTMPETKAFRDMTVDWYLDASLVYEDMVRPRPPARTKEELNSMIQDLNDRSERLKTNYEKLAEMDTDIRRQYHLQPPKRDDALYQYAGHH